MIADSLSGVHIPLPAVRPRQRSWGTSLPQSVILSLFVVRVLSNHNGAATLAGLAPYWRNGRPVRMALNRSSGSCPTVLVRCKPRPTFGDFPAFLTHSRLPPAAGAHCRSHSSRNLSWGTGSLPPSALRMAISLPSLPPFLPPVSGGSSCRGPGDRGPGIWVDAKHRKQINTEKHLWLDSL